MGKAILSYTIEQMPRDSDTTKIRELLIKAGDLNAKPLVSLLEPNTTQLLHGEVDQINATKMQPVSVTDTKTPSQDVIVKDNKESWMDRKRDAILVIATLIAGMAYQAGSNPPGGVWDQNDQIYTNLQGQNVTLRTGKFIMVVNYPRIYIIFWSFNTASFVAALTIILLITYTQLTTLGDNLVSRFEAKVIHVVSNWRHMDDGNIHGRNLPIRDASHYAWYPVGKHIYYSQLFSNRVVRICWHCFLSKCLPLLNLCHQEGGEICEEVV
ncbi:hypothetical protein LguiB_016459 [Lonicera macranthoides]